jgi:hypothetical protein
MAMLCFKYQAQSWNTAHIAYHFTHELSHFLAFLLESHASDPVSFSVITKD